MSAAPHYALASGTEITIHGATHQVLSTGAAGYKTIDIGTSLESFVPFVRFAQALKLSGTKILPPQRESSASLRLNGYFSAGALRDRQKEIGRFRIACSEAIVALEKQLSKENGGRVERLSGRALDDPQIRSRIVAYVRQALGVPVADGDGRGGRTKSLQLYRGRTLREYCDTYQNLGPDEDPLDAFVPLDHLKGNKTVRFSYRISELMMTAWEEVGLSTKKPSVSTVHKRLRDLLKDENERRQRNELPQLITPSPATLAAFRDSVFTRTELAIAHGGPKNARNKLGRGSTDLRALFPGEYVEIDECKVSLVLAAKFTGSWEILTNTQRAALEKFDNKIRKRFHILVMIDVATRMILAWVITEGPKGEATLELLRMATRSKKQEADLYGSTLEPIPALGIGHIKNDNGSGLRNAEVVGACTALGIINTVSRAYNSTDRPFIERAFGTLESVLISTLPGYTGRKPGDLPGYDAMASGVIEIDEFKALLSKFFLDEYPRMRHFGVGMNGRRPIDVFHELSKERGMFTPIDPTRRRIVLGVSQQVTPNDEGVRVFGGLWFNSDQLQLRRDRHDFPRKVSVFVDPDDLRVATVLAEGEQDPIDVQIQITAFADMTLAQVIDLLRLWRKEDPEGIEVHEDRLTQLRRERHDQLRELEKVRHVPRSYFTPNELAQKLEDVTRGSRVIPERQRVSHSDQWVRPGSLMALPGPQMPSFAVADDPSLLEMTATEATGSANFEDVAVADAEPQGRTIRKTSRQSGRQAATEPATAPQPLGRPTHVKDLK